MHDEDTSALMNFRLDQARECIQASKVVFAGGMFKLSANRSYYCIFHAMRAVLALERFDSKTHSGVISRFNQNYIRPGIFPARFSKIIHDAFKHRNDCDYMDSVVISKDDTAAMIEGAETFLNAVEKYLADK